MTGFPKFVRRTNSEQTRHPSSDKSDRLQTLRILVGIGSDWCLSGIVRCRVWLSVMFVRLSGNLVEVPTTKLRPSMQG